MKNFSTKEKNKKIVIYATVFLAVLIVVFAGILIFYKGGKKPLPVKPPQKEVLEEKTEEDIIHDLSVPVPGFQETEITEEIIESLAVPIKDSPGNENKDQPQEEKIIESLAKPTK